MIRNDQTGSERQGQYLGRSQRTARRQTDQNGVNVWSNASTRIRVKLWSKVSADGPSKWTGTCTTLYSMINATLLYMHIVVPASRLGWRARSGVFRGSAERSGYSETAAPSHSCHWHTSELPSTAPAKAEHVDMRTLVYASKERQKRQTNIASQPRITEK